MLRDQFILSSSIYMAAHSLGPMLKSSYHAIQRSMKREWSQSGIEAWSKHDWINMPTRVGNKLAAIIGADQNEVICCDSLTANLFKLLVGALKRSKRKVILTHEDNFPADLYMAEAAVKLFDASVTRCPISEMAMHINEHTAVVLITEVNYRTSEIVDMEIISKKAEKYGALLILDLAHSAGIIPINLKGQGVAAAVGCGYKYLNGGPGAPGFMYVAKEYQDCIESPLEGWMGHADPFAFMSEYKHASGMRKYLCGTPHILSLCSLEGSIDCLNKISIAEIRNKSSQLSQYFIELIQKYCPEMKIISPLHPEKRGGHVALQIRNAEEIQKHLVTQKVICDFREPQLLRFGFSPLYLHEEDVYESVKRLSLVLRSLK